ncbi:hypothetical protein AtubIFM57258_008096 [Aspergillus tubingensis]|nr:hypothetical protein AtubIFM57258_008096 [Aspergillus tubingensis]
MPPHVLLGANIQIIGVIDWEFSYAASAEFSAASPWWLLLEQPEYWPDEGHHKLWTLKRGTRVLGPMQESWESGGFLVSHAARRNFAFDMTFWQETDERFFGPAESPEVSWKMAVKLVYKKEKKNVKA